MTDSKVLVVSSDIFESLSPELQNIGRVLEKLGKIRIEERGRIMPTNKDINDPPEALTPTELEVLFEKNSRGVYDWQSKHRRNVLGYNQYLKYLKDIRCIEAEDRKAVMN
jgi:hypothetical protein